MDFAIRLSGSRTQVYQRFNMVIFGPVFIQEGAGEREGSMGQNPLLLTHKNLSTR